MLNENYLAIKLSLVLYLVGIYVLIYVYMFLHMCIINLHVYGCKYVFSCFTCYLVLTMTALLYWYPLLSFNKAY